MKFIKAFVGITGKMLYEKIFIDEASGFGLDLGGNYSYNNFSVAAVVSNIGSMNSLKLLKQNCQRLSDLAEVMYIKKII